jgi:tRNA modification GTPase
MEKTMQSYEPIAAISTPYGRGGIAVIRLSGEGSIMLAENIFVPKSKKRLSDIESDRAVYGDILRNGKRIDDGIATVFRAPRSFTGEDTVEISCHGGILLTESVLTSALESGFRLALGGEFSKRAFLNGKMSLTEAEAVIGLIDAESEEQLRLSASVTNGVLKNGVNKICDEITELLASVYAYIDYPDEDLTDVSPDELTERAERLLHETDMLVSSYRSGRAVNDGIKTAIVGKPNAGKSSVLNRLLGYDRAIVTSVAGTTRDTVEETAIIGRVTLRLCDTAGIRESSDEVERIGIERSIGKLNEAELILAVFDGSSPLDELDKDVIDRISATDAEVIAVINKSDISSESDIDIPFRTVTVSALDGSGFDELKKSVSDLYIDEKLNYDTTPVLTNARQFAAASEAKNRLESALNALKNGFTQDIAGMDLELALSFLREIDGRNVSEEITDRIFSRFCVGK